MVEYTYLIDSGKASMFNLCSKTVIIPKVFKVGAGRAKRSLIDLR